MKRISFGVVGGISAFLGACHPDHERDLAPALDQGAYPGAGELGAQSPSTSTSLPLSCHNTPDPALCCAAGQTLVEGTSIDDVLDLTASPDPHCVFALAGDDWVALGSAGGLAWLGAGHDGFDGSSAADVVLGGAGDDVVRTFGGDDELYGGAGNDTLQGGPGNDLIVPGPGLDTVDAGPGNDTVVINHLCEVERGELLDGSRDYDVLITPVSVQELTALGVTVQGFEEIVIEANPCASECAAPECGEHGTCAADAAGDGYCECEPGFTGPQCDIECEEGVGCELKVFYHGNGTVNGAIMRGGILFPATNEAEVEQGLKQWFAEQHELLQLDSVELLSVFDELVPSEPLFREQGQLRLLKLRQTYRGYRIYGPEVQMTATYAPGKGVIAFTGTVADPREDYLGLEDTVSQALAEKAILARWQEVGDVVEGVSVVGMELVAVPQAKALGWYGIIMGPTSSLVTQSLEYGYVVVPAAPAVSGGVQPLTLGYGFSRHPAPSDPVSIDVLGSPFADDIKESVATTQWSTLPTGGSLLGSTFTPGGIDSGVKLGSSRVQIYDAQSLAVGTSPAALTGVGSTFDAPRADPTPWNMQNTYLHLMAAADLMDPIKQHNWDYRTGKWPVGFDASRRADLVAFVNAGSGSCPNQPYCYKTILFPHEAKWTNQDHEFFRADTPGAEIYPSPTISVTIDNPAVDLHEFGHYIDDFTGAGLMGHEAPSGTGCHLDTTDETRPLMETIANMIASSLAVSMYGQIDFDSNCNAPYHSGAWSGGPPNPPAPSANCVANQAQIIDFASTRPTDSDGGGGYCNQMQGYRQHSVMQAWWSMVHGKVCQGEAPWTCSDIANLGDPAHAALEALHYGLSVGNHQWYKMFIENIGVYYACQYGAGVYADYVQVMSNHGLMAPNTPPPVCPDLCGDGIIGPNEACDDGNTIGGDGCSATCTIEGGGGGGGGANGEPCEDLWDYPGGTGLTNRPWGSAQTLEEELYYHWCGYNEALTCVVENEQFVCRECGPEKLPGCYCGSDEECITLGPGAQCYGPGLHGPEFGCFLPAQAPVYACKDPCQTQYKVCAWNPSESMSGTCFNEYCLEPGPDFACEREPGVECYPEAELCYMPGHPECQSEGASCDAFAGICSSRWSGQVWECCHGGYCLIPATAS